MNRNQRSQSGSFNMLFEALCVSPGFHKGIYWESLSSGLTELYFWMICLRPHVIYWRLKTNNLAALNKILRGCICKKVHFNLRSGNYLFSLFCWGSNYFVAAHNSNSIFHILRWCAECRSGSAQAAWSLGSLIQSGLWSGIGVGSRSLVSCMFNRFGMRDLFSNLKL